MGPHVIQEESSLSRTKMHIVKAIAGHNLDNQTNCSQIGNERA